MQSLPSNLPREDVVHGGGAAACKCVACVTGLQQIGEDMSDVLDQLVVKAPIARALHRN
jgi:hypothetical protein